MKRSLLAGLLLVLAAAPVHSVAAWAATDADYTSAMRETAHAMIVPGYQALATSTEALRGELAALCKAPDAAQLDRTRAAFAAVTLQWARMQYLDFGPVSEHQRASRIAYWPDKRNVVGRQLSEVLDKRDPARLAKEHFATTSVGVQGLPALERLLYEGDALKAVAADTPDAAFRCALLAAIGDNLDTIADEIVDGWTGGDTPYLRSLDQPDPDDEEAPKPRDAAARLLNDLLTATIAIRDMKLLAPLGDSLAKAKPQAAEYWRSALSLDVLKANLEGLREAFGTDGGLGKLLRAAPEGGPVADALAATLDQAFQARDRIALPLDQAVADAAQRKAVEALGEQLLRLRDLLSGPVATDLNLPIGFNALDGD